MFFPFFRPQFFPHFKQPYVKRLKIYWQRNGNGIPNATESDKNDSIII